jgi:hypothetical protein
MVLQGLVHSKNKQVHETQNVGSYLSLNSEPADDLRTDPVRVWLSNRSLARKRLVRDVRRDLLALTESK